MTNRTEKIPEIHFERYVRQTRKLFHTNPVANLSQVIAKEGLDPKLTGEGLVDAYLREKLPGYALAQASNDRRAYDTLRVIREGLFHAVQFDRHKRVFRLEKGLTQRLLHTSIEKVDTQFVRSPFPSIYFSCPHNEELVVPDEGGCEHLVEGFYLWHLSDQDARSISLTNDRRRRTAYDEVGCDTCSVVKILAVGKPSGKDHDSLLFYNTFFLGEGDVFGHMERALQKWTYQDNNRPYVEALFRFVLNVLLYVSAPEAEFGEIFAKFEKPLSPKQKEAVDLRNAGVSKINQKSVGKSISIVRGLDAHYGKTSLNHRVVGCPRWLVRGHWRNQAHGPQHSQRRLLWVLRRPPQEYPLLIAAYTPGECSPYRLCRKLLMTWVLQHGISFPPT